MILDYVSLIYKDIKGKKFSSFLTFFAISLGILSIFVIVLVGAGFEQSINKQFEQLGSNRLMISYSGSQLTSLSFKKGLTDTEVKLIENKPYISKVSPHIIKNVQIQYGNEYVQRLILGSYNDQEYFEDFNVKIEEGRYPKPNEKYAMVVGPVFAEELFSREVKVGSNLYLKGTKFKVVGITESVGNPEDDKNVYVNIDTLRDLYEMGDQVQLIYATVTEGYDVKTAAENVDILLENKLGDDTVDVTTFDEMLQQFNSILNIVRLTLGGIALVSLVVGALGIINTMYVIIAEKTKDIGIMKAIGATNFDIFSIYVFEAGFFGLLGGILGVFLGGIGALLFGEWAQANGYTFLEITIDPIIVGILLAFSFIVGAFAGFMPAYKASRLKIVDTFRK